MILAHAMWKRLGANPGIIGSALLMDGEPYTVVGVLAPGLRDRGAPVSVPLVLMPERRDQGGQRLNVTGRLRARRPIREAQADMDSIVLGLPLVRIGEFRWNPFEAPPALMIGNW